MSVKKFCVTIAALLVLSGTSWAGSYEALIDLQHSSITFELDSTWHTIEGEAKEYSGKIVFDDPISPTRVMGKIEIKAESITTGLSLRDDKLHDHSLEVKTFPLITYTITGYRAGTLFGELAIKDVIKPVSLKVTSEKKEGYIEHVGVTQIDWSQYNVKDPSIFIATVDKKVTIKVIVRLAID